MKVSEILKKVLVNGNKGMNPKMGMFIEGTAVIRDKEGKVKKRIKMKKKSIFG